MAAYCAAHLVRMSWARRLIDIGALTSGINGFTYSGINGFTFSGINGFTYSDITVISGINGFTYSSGIYQFELAAQFNLATSSHNLMNIDEGLSWFTRVFTCELQFYVSSLSFRF